jgi:hypothetical protein
MASRPPGRRQSPARGAVHLRVDTIEEAMAIVLFHLVPASRG